MKKCLFILLFLISCISFSQNNHIVKTEDGRRVWLKADFTWEYIDADTPKESATEAPMKKDECKLADGFTEPELDNKIQSQLKKGRATIDHVKAKVAKDYNCKVEDVFLLSFTEQKAKAVYYFCANGKKVTYKRTGHAIIESGKLF